MSLCGTTGLDLESNLVETRIKNSDMVLITESELNVSAIYIQFRGHPFCWDIQTIYENAIFRLGFLPAVAGCLGTLPWDRLPTLSPQFRPGPHPPPSRGFNFQRTEKPILPYRP